MATAEAEQAWGLAEEPFEIVVAAGVHSWVYTAWSDRGGVRGGLDESRVLDEARTLAGQAVFLEPLDIGWRPEFDHWLGVFASVPLPEHGVLPGGMRRLWGPTAPELETILANPEVQMWTLPRLHQHPFEGGAVIRCCLVRSIVASDLEDANRRAQWAICHWDAFDFW